MSQQIYYKIVIALIAALIIAGCASSGPALREKLDPLTGVTVTYTNTPLIMYRDNSGRAAYAKNYIHLGPIQVNRGGTYQHYLWLTAWNTIDSPTPAENQDDLDSIVIFADGEPLLLDLAGRTPEAIGTSEPVYLKPVASAADAYYRVTADQIRLIVEARDLRLRTTGGRSREFGLWDDQRAARSDLREFLNRAFL